MRIVKLKGAVTLYEIGLFLFALSIVVFSFIMAHHYIQLKSHDAVENVQVHATPSKDRISFTGKFDRSIRCMNTSLEVHFTNVNTNEIVVLNENNVTLSPTYNVPAGKDHKIALEYVLPTNITTGVWLPEFKGTFRCVNALFVDEKYQTLKSNLIYINKK